MKDPKFVLGNSQISFKNTRGSHYYPVNDSRNDFPKEVLQFARQYFASTRIQNELLDRVVDYCRDPLKQENLLTSVIASPLWDIHEAQRRSHAGPLKYIIAQLEHEGIEVHELLYRAVLKSLKQDRQFRYRIFFDTPLTRYIALQERTEQIVQGTTGLSCWQASCDLANYLLKSGRGIIQDKDVLELGSGCGLVGIALAASGVTKSVTLSDCNDAVVGLMRENIATNFSEDLDVFSKIRTIFMEWEDATMENAPVLADVLIASDVVYDPESIGPLVRAIRELLSAWKYMGRKNPCCIIANTLRNEETINGFLTYAISKGLTVKEQFMFGNGKFAFENGTVEDETLFPFTSNVHCPTVFHKFLLEDNPNDHNFDDGDD